MPSIVIPSTSIQKGTISEHRRFQLVTMANSHWWTYPSGMCLKESTKLVATSTSHDRELLKSEKISSSFFSVWCCNWRGTNIAILISFQAHTFYLLAALQLIPQRGPQYNLKQSNKIKNLNNSQYLKEKPQPPFFSVSPHYWKHL